MTERYEFDLVFALPGDCRMEPFDLADAVYASGFEDAVVGTGQAGLLAVSVDAEGDDAESAILEVARAILRHLPKGTALREVRPDLVSLADVAGRLKVKRQAIQKRRMPLPAMAGHYRVTEVFSCLSEQVAANHRARFSLDAAQPWFAAGKGAQRVNACLVLGSLDPLSLVARDGNRDRG